MGPTSWQIELRGKILHGLTHAFQRMLLLCNAALHVTRQAVVLYAVTSVSVEPGAYILRVEISNHPTDTRSHNTGKRKLHS